MTKQLSVVAMALLLGACATYPPLVQQGRDPSQWPDASTTGAGWTTDTTVSQASGQANCVVQGPGPLTAFLIDLPSGARSRFVTAIAGDNLYPGSTVYLSVGDQRFAGEERIQLTEELLAALKGGTLAWISWSPWPSGVRQEKAVNLTGFAAAYDKCIANLERIR